MVHASSQQEFSDADWRAVATGDQSKKLKLLLSGLTTATTRTWTAPDASGTVALLGATMGGSGTISIIDFGTYTPTLTNTTNVAASTAFVCQYLRVGNVVTVSGRVQIDPTSAGVSTELGVSLPIASNFANSEELGGASVTVSSDGYSILADTTNDRATFQGIPANASNRSCYFSFTYQVI